MDLDIMKNLEDEINNSISELKEKKIEIKDEDLPSTMRIMLSGISNSKALDFLFSTNIDKLLEKLFASVNSGNLDKIIDNEEEIKRIFISLGFGEGSFEGPISKAVLQNIKSSVESNKFLRIKSNFKKAIFVVKSLERQQKFIKDSYLKKKHADAVYAIKNILRFISKIYKNRKIINSRVFNGLNNIVKEDYEIEEKLVSLF